MQHCWCDFVISFIQFDIGYHRRPPNCHLIGEPEIFIRIKLKVSKKTGGGFCPLSIMVASWFRPNVWVFIRSLEVSDEIQWEYLNSAPQMGCNLCIHILYSVFCILYPDPCFLSVLSPHLCILCHIVCIQYSIS